MSHRMHNSRGKNDGPSPIHSLPFPSLNPKEVLNTCVDNTLGRSDYTNLTALAIKALIKDICHYRESFSGRALWSMATYHCGNSLETNSWASALNFWVGSFAVVPTILTSLKNGFGVHFSLRTIGPRTGICSFSKGDLFSFS